MGKDVKYIEKKYLCHYCGYEFTKEVKDFYPKGVSYQVKCPFCDNYLKN